MTKKVLKIDLEFIKKEIEKLELGKEFDYFIYYVIGKSPDFFNGYFYSLYCCGKIRNMRTFYRISKLYNQYYRGVTNEQESIEN